MSLVDYPHSATPEEVEAYKLGKSEAAKQLRICAQQVIEYEIALNQVRRCTTALEAFETATRALARHKAAK